MKNLKKWSWILAILMLMGCGDDSEELSQDIQEQIDVQEDSGQSSETKRFQGMHVNTVLMGSGDNAEIVKAVPHQSKVILVSSKARKITLFEIDGDALNKVQEAVLFPNDASESELTHIDISEDGTWAALSRTILEVNDQGQQIHCGGEVVLIRTEEGHFGEVIKRIPVGPMPDSVDISRDGHWVVSANEKDSIEAWGKCEVAEDKASISVIDLSQGPENAEEKYRIDMVNGETGPREPETIIVASDNDLVVSTLQDSHEIAMFKISELGEAPTFEDLKIYALPPNDLGAGPWPDGVTEFRDAQGHQYFVSAGEWNDTFQIFNAQGEMLNTVFLDPSDLPENLPRVIDEGSPYFSPDSVVSFEYGHRNYLAFSLRHSGAVAIYDVSDIHSVQFNSAIQVGDREQGGQDEDGSTIRPEGITAAHDGSFIVTANEGESSISLIRPVE